MDALTHLCLPLAVACAIDERVTRSPAVLALAPFGLLADADKFLGMPGALHSLLTLAPICLAILAGERLLRGRLSITPLVVALILSHLLLDFFDGGPVPLFFPLVESGVGLSYPAKIAFGEGLLGVAIDGPLFALRGATPRPGHNAYGFINGTGITSALVLTVIYLATGPSIRQQLATLGLIDRREAR